MVCFMLSTSGIEAVGFRVTVVFDTWVCASTPFRLAMALPKNLLH